MVLALRTDVVVLVVVLVIAGKSKHRSRIEEQGMAY